MASKKIMKHKPIAESKVTCGFGPRKLSLASASTDHKGVDMGGSTTVLYSAVDGKVTQKGYNSLRGYYVEIGGANSYSFFYQHMKGPSNVGIGKSVETGDQIGTKGHTGASTAPHLHFEIRKNGVPVNPVPYFIASFKSTKIVHTLSYHKSITTVQWILENKRWQEQLKEYGFYKSGIIDGLFGNMTRKGTKTFQKKYGLKPDGIVGPQTRAMAEKKGWKIS